MHKLLNLKRLLRVKRGLHKTTIMALALVSSLFFVSVSTAKTVEYTCNEGIPLIVEYIELNDVSIAKISHDSSPKITLVNVRSGSGSRYSNGDWVLHVKGKTALVGTQGQTDDTCTEVSKTGGEMPLTKFVSYPRKAKSWGGVVRAGPGMHYGKKASLKQGEWITLLGPTNDVMNNYPWFKIKYRGRIGYQWGGIICSVGPHVHGTYQVCD